MPYIQTIEPENATGILADLYSQISRSRGVVANLYRTQSLDPESLRCHRDLFSATMFSEGGLSRLEREAIGVAVSAANECRYTMHHHSKSLIAAGGSQDLVEALQDGDEPDWETKRIRRLVYFARKLTLMPASMSKKDLEDLRIAGITDLEILQAVQVTAYFNYVNRLADALGVEIEAE